MTVWFASQSCTSSGVNWKCHFILPVSRIERQDGVGVEVVARPVVGVPVRRGVAGGPVQELQVRIVGAGEPRGAAAGLPPVALPPGLEAGLTGRGNRVRAPHQLAGLRVVRVDEAADARFGPRHADDDLPVERQRRQRQVVPGLVVLHRHVPAHAARARVERDEMPVHRAEEHRVVENRDAAIDRRRADDDDVGRDGRRVGPHGPSGAHVERRDGARRFGDVHDAVGHERRRLHHARPHLVRPRHLEARDGLAVDLIQRRVALRLVGPGIGEPVLRLAHGAQQPLIRHLRVDEDGTSP